MARHGLDVTNIRPPDDLGDIASLGVTLSKAKQILVRLQQAVVAVQADDHAVLRPDCSSCGQACHVKDRHVRFQGFRTQSPTGLFSFRLPPLMQACVVEGGH
jgi:hypothetical protein